MILSVQVQRTSWKHLRPKRISKPIHARLKFDLEKLKDPNVLESYIPTPLNGGLDRVALYRLGFQEVLFQFVSSNGWTLHERFSKGWSF